MSKKTVKNICSITPKELKTGMKLFYYGTKKQANRIHSAQKRKFGTKDGLYLLNHVGDIIVDSDGFITIYEQDGAGKFGESTIDEYKEQCKEYDSQVYIGVYPKLDAEQLIFYKRAIKKYAAEDSVLNYSYKSLINYLYNSFAYKYFGKDWWIWNKEPKGTTCSQISAKLSNEYLGIDFGKEWWKVYPCEIAMHGDIKLYKLVL